MQSMSTKPTEIHPGCYSMSCNNNFMKNHDILQTKTQTMVYQAIRGNNNYLAKTNKHKQPPPKRKMIALGCNLEHAIVLVLLGMFCSGWLFVLVCLCKIVVAAPNCLMTTLDWCVLARGNTHLSSLVNYTQRSYAPLCSTSTTSRLMRYFPEVIIFSVYARHLHVTPPPWSSLLFCVILFA